MGIGSAAGKRGLVLGKGGEERVEAALARKKKSEHDGDGDSESDAERESEDVKAHKPKAEEVDWLDPSARNAAQLAPPAIVTAQLQAASATANEPVRARSLEELLPVLVRKIAWAGDKHRGTVRLELGAGAYAGTTVTVHADGGRVRVEIGGREGPDLDRLRTRLDARLRGHGLDVESVT
jgi:hypothetical protein